MLIVCTVDRVMGNMPVVEWNKFKQQCSHLRNIDFPTSARRPIFDMLLGLDCTNLLYAIQEVRGKSGEPIARLTPPGWTCIGNTGQTSQEVCHTDFAYTYFVKNQTEIEQINSTLKQFWEIENVQSPHDAPFVRIEEQLAMKKVESTLSFQNQMYRVGIPRKSDNYKMALRRLENTEKRMKKSPAVAEAYNKCMNSMSRKFTLQKFKSQSGQRQGGTFNTFRY